ncbi:MAG: TrmH family RNA methyltransferase [Anaerolineales bacterium]|nr:TrmH family RNA methyltransferase [Anaerolineales bacterium]
MDNIRSGWNVGAMFRTADGLGGGRMHLCGITPTPEQPQVAKTALGAEKTVTWVYASNAVKHCQKLQQQGYVIWALEDTPEAEAIFGLQGEHLVCERRVLVVGNEVTGVDPAILALCERVLAIPMLGAKRSLNVAVAYGIALSALQHLL